MGRIAAPQTEKGRARLVARDLDNAPNTLLRSALEVAKIPRRERVHHLGGPAPRLSARATVRVAIWCAERVRGLASREQRVAIDALLAAAHALLGDPDRIFSPAEPQPTDPLVAIAWFARDAALTASRNPITTRRPTREAVLWALRAERDRAPVAEQAAAMARFCDELDDCLVRIEAESELATRLKVAPAFTRVAWRAPPGNEFTHAPGFILELRPGVYGVFAKLGKRYTWNEGTRDDVLATVPDAWMESAVARLIPGG